MVFLDRPIYRFRRDERSKKKPGATLGLDAVRLDAHQNRHARSPELCRVRNDKLLFGSTFNLEKPSRREQFC